MSKVKSYVVSFQTLDPKIQNLLREAVEVRNLAYCPYSNFQVGACIACKDGSIYRGCNIENASYSVTICAERTAYAKAISEGKLNFTTLALIAYQESSFTSPCGACRQFMNEFGNVDIYISKPDLSQVLVTTLDEILPLSFQHNSDYTF